MLVASSAATIGGGGGGIGGWALITTRVARLLVAIVAAPTNQLAGCWHARTRARGIDGRCVWSPRQPLHRILALERKARQLAARARDDLPPRRPRVVAAGLGRRDRGERRLVVVQRDRDLAAVVLQGRHVSVEPHALDDAPLGVNAPSEPRRAALLTAPSPKRAGALRVADVDEVPVWVHPPPNQRHLAHAGSHAAVACASVRPGCEGSP